MMLMLMLMMMMICQVIVSPAGGPVTVSEDAAVGHTVFTCTASDTDTPDTQLRFSITGEFQTPRLPPTMGTARLAFIGLYRLEAIHHTLAHVQKRMDTSATSATAVVVIVVVATSSSSRSNNMNFFFLR